jgi:4'-phosphopantetheinyl transferase
MTDAYWLEQTEDDLPAENNWLNATEAVRLQGMRFAKRRADWRLGRWTAKNAVAACLDLPAHPQVLADMEIRPSQSGAPDVFFRNQSAAVAISLSHRSGVAVCAVTASGVALGCDLEVVEPRSDAFVADYFSAEEQELVARASAAERTCLVALLWSGKESALKALRAGLRLDTRCVIVNPDNVSFDLSGWRPLHVRHTDGQVFHGWWQHSDNLVRTLVAAPPPAPPILLQIPAYLADPAPEFS